MVTVCCWSGFMESWWQGRTRSKASTRGWWRSPAQTWQVSCALYSSYPSVLRNYYQLYIIDCMIWNNSVCEVVVVGVVESGMCRLFDVMFPSCFNHPECIRQKANAETSSPKMCSAMWSILWVTAKVTQHTQGFSSIKALFKCKCSELIQWTCFVLSLAWPVYTFTLWIYCDCSGFSSQSIRVREQMVVKLLENTWWKCKNSFSMHSVNACWHCSYCCILLCTQRAL